LNLQRLSRVSGPMEVYITYNSEFQLAICVSCKCGLPSNHVSRHMSRYHTATWKAHRSELRKYVQGLTLKPTSELSHPATLQTAIPGLAIKEGWCCGEENCLFCSISAKHIENHCRTRHGSQAAKKRRWFPCQMQTLLGNPNIR